MHRRHLVYLSFIGLSLSQFVPAISASTVIIPSFQEMVKNADTILEGVVQSQTVRWEKAAGSAPAIFTTVSLQVTGSYKGSAGKILELKIAGGQIGDTRDIVEGAPQFEVGKTYIIFVQNNGKQLIPLVAMTYGQFKIVRDAQGVDRLARSDNSPVLSMKQLDTGAGKITGENDYPKNAALAAKSLPGLAGSEFTSEIQRVVREQARGK